MLAPFALRYYNDSILFTVVSREYAEHRKVAKVYPVGDLIDPKAKDVPGQLAALANAFRVVDPDSFGKADDRNFQSIGKWNGNDRNVMVVVANEATHNKVLHLVKNLRDIRKIAGTAAPDEMNQKIAPEFR